MTMNPHEWQAARSQTRKDGLEKLGIFVWITIVFLSGTYFRNRPADVAPELDWLVATQLIACALGGGLGLALMRKGHRLGFAGKSILVYIGVAGFSVILSPYPKSVMGYWLLLLGATLLTIGLVNRAASVADMIKLEAAWLIAVLIILIVNVTTSVANAHLDPQYGDVARLGMGWIGASQLGYVACYAFCMSFVDEEFKHPALLWALRLLLLVVLLASRTRVPLLICLVTLAIRFAHRRKTAHQWVLVPISFAAVLTSFFLAVSFDVPIAADLSDYITRGSPDSLTTFSGRTAIWSHAFRILTENPERFFLGFGYGISRLIVNEVGDPLFFYDHTHNEFLEIVFGMGVICLIPYIALLVYSSRWFTFLRQGVGEFTTSFALRAFTVMVALYINSLFAVPLSAKIAPYTILIIFYLLALDKGRHFGEIANIEDTSGKPK